jgi:hypothetical protein
MLPVHWGCLIDETEVVQSSQSSGSPPMPSRCASWVDVIDMWVCPPLTVIGVHGSDGKEVKMPSLPYTILNVGSERPLRFLLHGINGEVPNCSPSSLCP